MNEILPKQGPKKQNVSFFERPAVQKDEIPIGKGVPIGFERIYHPGIGIGGVYGTWGESYNNEALVSFIEQSMGEPLSDKDRMDLSPLGFVSRHHISDLSDDEHTDLEVEVGARFLREAAAVNNWDPGEVEGVLIGMSAPATNDYTERIAREAGIPESALKVSMHKACDSSVGALHLALNPELLANQRLEINIAKELSGKKVLVGAI